MKSVRLFLWNYFLKHLPGYALRRFLFNRWLGNNVAKHTSLHRGIDIWGIGGIEIGADSTVNKYASLDGRGQLSIGDNVSISAFSKILSASHDVNSGEFAYITKKVVIEDYAWIGTGALILPGVTIKKGAVVAAGSIVTKDVEEYTIVAGNPAKYIDQRNKNLNYSPYWAPYSE